MSKETPKSVEASKPAETDASKAIREAISAAITEALPVATAMAAKVQAEANRPAPEAPPPGVFSREKCAACQQYLVACKGKHKKMAVYPKNSRYGRWFQGVRINGVLYLSNNSSHQITVPADNNIEHLVEVWETNEEQVTQGRNVEHNSGGIGPNAGGFNPAGGNSGVFR